MMNERTFLEKARSLGIAVLTSSDISKIIGEDGQRLNTFLYRLEKRGVIQRLERGKYYLPGTDIEAIASSIFSPSYISFLYALSFYNLTTQIPNEIVIVTLKSRSMAQLNGFKLQFMKIKKERFFGMMRIRKDQNTFVTMASVEKAILDCLAYPEYCPLAESSYATSLALESNRLDKALIVRLVNRLGSFVAAKRLGYIFELNGVDIFKELEPMINKSYDLVNPQLPARGESISKWKLIKNQELENVNQ